jgi:hypothetical protein
MANIQKKLLIVGFTFLLSWIILPANKVFAQSSKAKKRILVDISHGQKFWNDPADMEGQNPQSLERIKYMTAELVKNANALNAEVSYQKTKITPDALAKCDLLFIHIPSSKYEAGEVKAIQQYLQKGGSMFLVMEQDYWATLAQVNVNDMVSPFGIVFKTDSPVKQSGGYTKVGAITDKRFSIPYHGARIVEGGTPFCFSNHTNDYPFGVYKEVKNGGKIIAMGDGMVSLYMTSWEGVNNYQCSEFMHDAFAWLLK